MGGFLLTVTLLAAAYIWWRVGVARRAEAWEESLREGYRRRIAEDPTNIGAYEALADSLYRAGRLDEARDTYMGALDAGSDNLVMDRTHYKLRQVDADIRARAQARGRGRHPARATRELEFCRHCGAPNPPQRRHCELCGRLMPFRSFLAALGNRELQRASAESVCVIAVVVVLLRVFDFLPIDVQGATVIAAVMVIGWRFLQSIEGRRG